MSQLEINQPTLRIPGTQISLFERTPLEHGHKRGYFRDEATRALLGLSTAWNEAYIMLVSCIDYALDMTCIQSVSQCFIVGGIL